jgi:hypothetical protein
MGNPGWQKLIGRGRWVVSGRLLRLRRFGGDSSRAAGASVEEAEESIRQRLYGERRTVQVLAPERSLGAGAERGAGRGPGHERYRARRGLSGGVAVSETSGLSIDADR